MKIFKSTHTHIQIYTYKSTHTNKPLTHKELWTKEMALTQLTFLFYVKICRVMHNYLPTKIDKTTLKIINIFVCSSQLIA